jgi:hypothetical protein
VELVHDRLRRFGLVLGSVARMSPEALSNTARKKRQIGFPSARHLPHGIADVLGELANAVVPRLDVAERPAERLGDLIERQAAVQRAAAGRFLLGAVGL